MDREGVAASLREGYSDGRLSLDEFQERLDRAYASKTLGELDTLTADLAASSGPSAIPVASPEPAPRSRAIRDRVLAYVILMLFLIAIWAVSGRHGSFWPIWPIIVGAFILAMSILGTRGRDARRDMRHDARRAARAERRAARRGYRNDDR
jgi:hypothetical protein